jgi:4-amino-4-deoxy-L-arabinose transferase-like glycosyltransferase
MFTSMSKTEKYLLALWFIANLILGALTVHEYGISVDEPNNQRYAADSLAAYPSFFGLFYEPYYHPSYDGHGPAFVTIAAIFVGIAQAILPNAFAPDLWHYSYFITFQLTGLCLYWLTRRWFNIWTAWGVLVIFSTQPLLLGHAFINPKDTPFMFFLTLSVLWGFRMADAISANETYVSLETPARSLAEKFQRADPQRRRRFLTYLTLASLTALALIVFSSQIDSLVGQVVAFFYTAEPDSWAGQVFNAIASPASDIPMEDYVNKAIRLFQRVERGLLIAGVLFFLAYFGLLVSQATPSTFLRNTWTQRHKLGGWLGDSTKWLQRALNAGSLKVWFTQFFRALRSPYVILAGIALGLATGIRAIGPVAGVIVFLYMLAKVRSRAWPTAVAYSLVAGIMTYIAWPRLWDAPIPRYLEALGIASNFPNFPGRVLFNGQLYSARELPSSYLPVLLNIQFTEPAILCIYIGLGVLTWRLLSNRLRTDLLLYIGLGFALPLFGLILLNSTLYNNFRQALFLIPAMFLLAAFALELAFNKIAQHWVRVLLIAAIALPGVYSTAKLYPYEYVYYNSLVGGPAGAVHRYEMDYWRISLREMALELNEVASPGSLIVVTRSAGLLARYTRPDLVIDKPINSILDLDSGYDYIVQVTRGKGGDLYPEINSLIVIERDGAVLVTAKYVKGVSGK